MREVKQIDGNSTFGQHRGKVLSRLKHKNPDTP